MRPPRVEWRESRVPSWAGGQRSAIPRGPSSTAPRAGGTSAGGSESRGGVVLVGSRQSADWTASPARVVSWWVAAHGQGLRGSDRQLWITLPTSPVRTAMISHGRLPCVKQPRTDQSHGPPRQSLTLFHTPCLVLVISQKFSKFSITSNLTAHAWCIKYIWKQKLTAQFICKSRDESFKPSYSMTGQYLSNKNENATVSKSKNFTNWTRP